MNIFYLDNDPVKAASYHCDKHVVKMIVEYAQLLSTAHRLLDGELYSDASSGRTRKRWRLPAELDDKLYKATHINHPCALWARDNANNYKWLYDLFVALCDEYTYRYEKVHLTDSKLREVLSVVPRNIVKGRMTVPQAMPDYCKCLNVVDAYRNYYRLEKASMLNFKCREIPHWL